MTSHLLPLPTPPACGSLVDRDHATPRVSIIDYDGDVRHRGERVRGGGRGGAADRVPRAASPRPPSVS
ncbi:hypothetical protein RR46_14986 [Papilio xuthus]|uniref:Uncharacterized protein n=1 Tax=Papilio xuthus TaxID=66420 RepID=A0A194PDZ4_PAPXU|nr:hypothetical protein RR46_14986 [Papilio xuthus]